MGDESASMFAGQPQPVEIHHRGIWYSGELIGWRHESNGRVSARVRCRVDGLRHSTWMDLADLRLPDPARPPHKETYPAVVRRSAVPGSPDDDDATRPQPLLAAIGTRPAKPPHAVQPPPARPAGPPQRPAELPQRHETAAARRHQHLRRHEASLSAV